MTATEAINAAGLAHRAAAAGSKTDLVQRVYTLPRENLFRPAPPRSRAR